MSEARTTLDDLEMRSEFAGRHIGPRRDDVAAMLGIVGYESLTALVDAAVPAKIRAKAPLALPAGRTEAEVLADLRRIAARNAPVKSLIGMGYYGTHLPSVIQRNVLENPGWYTAYTPYQPEISQGRLETLLNFQTMVCDLTGMPLANASLLDEATAAAEAMTMCRRLSKAKGQVFFVDSDCFPQTIDVLQTRAAALGIALKIGDAGAELPADGVFGVLLQYPAASGSIRDTSAVVAAAHGQGALVTVASDLLALTLLTPPGEWGADIVVGSAQRFGVPMGFGGPHAAFFATREEHRRATPGRIVGVSVDRDGRPALRLALQTREQHIRREKATSNICTAQVLLAVISGLYAAYHGPDRLRTIGMRVHRLTAILAEGLRRRGLDVAPEAFFDTISVRVGDAGAVHARARAAGYNLRRIDGGRVGLSLDETVTREDVAALWRVLSPTDGDEAPDVVTLDTVVADALPDSLRRTSAYLTHSCFNSHRSETEMMRYLRRLQDRDVALDRSMIPLGSCTMKLNAATEMAPVTWPAFADVHPFAPLDQTAGYRELIDGLEAMLKEITGFDAFSMQPNAGSQGEYAGLLAIRRYHLSRGDDGRNVCLIPSSAHGTNPASAVMAGMRVVVVACDDDGNIDVADLEAKAAAHRDTLAALMVTYPSTHGVFEESIGLICAAVHRAGGQVYMDGANLNAMVGICRPAEFGADVAHLNLHKTFCIPHGGGGPGVGPIGVKAHLAPFLPSHVLRPEAAPAGASAGTGAGGAHAVSAAPWGSALILPISWAYIALMGREGLTRATEVAILNANYVARRLGDCFPVLYTGPHGLVAHECIVDLRGLPKGLQVDDVAKRLMDYGFHAPTMSWPVAGTLMIEPTESEGKREIDRFCDAMISIAAEIEEVRAGRLPADDNPLVNAPHTTRDLVASEWRHPYSRETAVWPAENLRREKYWPPVSRIDQAYGDRHLVCSCPPLDAYSEAAE